MPQGLSRKIRPGERAISLAVEFNRSASRELKAGDHVDVLAVTPIPGREKGRISRLIVSDVEVLSVENSGEPQRWKSRNLMVTLRVSSKGAAAIASAEPAATIRLVLRGSGDVSSTMPESIAFAPGEGITPYEPQTQHADRLITPGMRAITIDVAPTDGIGAVFRPGDRVDVVVTCPWGNISLKAQDRPGERAVLRQTHRNSRILFQDVKVIATDQSLVWNAHDNHPISRVTLEVTPQEAEKLTVLADSKKGRAVIRLISRNRNDHEVVRTSGAELLDLLSKKRAYRRVDMIRGPLRRDQTFYR